MSKTQPKIEKLILRKFRGATTETVIDFSDKKIALLFGENGTGKTTVIDAIDFVCNRQVGSLKDKSSTRPKEHLPAIGYRISDVCVDLHSDGKTWTGRHNGRDVVVEGEDSLPAVFILRRNKLLQLVEAPPSERYNELRAFIEVGNIEKCEQTLREAVKECGERFNRFATLQSEAEAALQNFWQADTKTDLTAVEWAKLKAGADVSLNEEKLKKLGDILRVFAEFQQQEKDYAEAAVAMQTARNALQEIENQIAAQEAESEGENFRLIELLRTLETLISAQDANQCPACLSSVDIETLRRQTAERLSRLKAAEELQNRSKQAKDELAQSEAVYRNARENLMRAAESFSAAILAFYSVAGFMPREVSDEEKRKFESVVERRGAFETRGELLEFSQMANHVFPNVLQRHENLQKDVNQFEAIKNSYKRYQESVLQTREEERLFPRLEAAYEIVRQTRIEFTQSILDEVSDDCARYFSKIHPNEPLNLTGLRLEENRRGSLHQQAFFEEHQDIVPQAYFSESHLDTLGFCFWLAIAKKASGGNAILVLDDAFTSVDSKHIERIVELLVEESGNFNQIIVSTHQRRWHNYYKYKIGSDKSKVLEFGRWGKNRGITIQSSKSEFEQLKELLAAAILDRQAIVSKAGVLLEKIFDDLTIVFACSVKRKAENNYTLDELLSSTSKLFNTISLEFPKRDDGGNPVEPLEYEQQPLKDLHASIRDLIAVRNLVGAHYNTLAEEYPDDKIEEIGNIALRLASQLTCPKCRNFAFRKLSDDKSYRFCGCKTAPLRITPPCF